MDDTNYLSQHSTELINTNHITAWELMHLDCPQFPDSNTMLIFYVHHAVMDGSTVGGLMRIFNDIYMSKNSLL